ncbi:MAG: hypothetical protein FJX90_08485 [Bacteroidetes bacterium]|nr:hypothetical protein [Bacteroidota bacterium]
MKNYIALVVVLFTLLSCHRHEENSATITISSPDPAVYFVGGDTIFIQGSVVAESEMHGMTIQLLNDANDSVMYTYSNEEHLASYTFNQFYVNQVAEHMDVRLEVVAELDHDGNEAKKTMLLHLYP